MLVALTIPNCTGVSAVRARGEDVLEEGSFVDPPPVSFGIVSDEAGPDRHRVTLRLRFQNGGRGDSYPMQVLVGNSTQSRARSDDAVLAFTLVMVKSVGGPLSMTIAQADLHNAFVREIWRA